MGVEALELLLLVACDAQQDGCILTTQVRGRKDTQAPPRRKETTILVLAEDGLDVAPNRIQECSVPAACLLPLPIEPHEFAHNIMEDRFARGLEGDLCFFIQSPPRLDLFRIIQRQGIVNCAARLEAAQSYLPQQLRFAGWGKAASRQDDVLHEKKNPSHNPVHWKRQLQVIPESDGMFEVHLQVLDVGCLPLLRHLVPHRLGRCENCNDFVQVPEHVLQVTLDHKVALAL